jgi:hypothetical protein
LPGVVVQADRVRLIEPERARHTKWWLPARSASCPSTVLLKSSAHHRCF